ncbi:MAG: redoxin family protein [Deltaproteobacteria bacterium]|nr:redoxin family protein [Deltaproteobacteria bacterium]
MRRLHFKFLPLLAFVAGCGANAASPAATQVADVHVDSNPAQAAECGSGAVADTNSGTPDAVQDQGAPAPDVPKAEEKLQPGAFQSPWVLVKRLQEQNGHMHTDEVRYRASDKRLFQCSYTFNVIDAAVPATMKFLAQGIKHVIPNDKRSGGCIHLAPDNAIVWTTHRGNVQNPTFVTGWDISKFSADGKTMTPQQVPVLQEPGESYEGIDAANGLVYVALRLNGLGIYQPDPATHALTRLGSVSGLGSTWGVRVVGTTAYVTDIDGSFATVDVSDPKAPKLLGKLAIPGVAKGLTVEGKLVYLAAGEAGLVVLDVSNPSKPVILSQTKTLGSAIRTAYADGRVVVAAWNDTRAYDVSNPAAPKLIGALRLTTDTVYPSPYAEDGHPPATARTMGVAMNGKDIFVGNWWVPYAFALHPERAAPHLVVPEAANVIDFGPVAAGQSKAISFKLSNHGTAPLTIFSIWTGAANFTVKQTQLRINPGESAALDLAFAATATATKEYALLSLFSDDPDQPKRQAFLVANQAGFGVGKPLPETKGILVDGDEWSSSSAKGKVLLLGYWASFCPVCSVEVKDYQDRFQKKFGDKIEVVKLNANVPDTMDIVQAYVKNLGITYKIGLEDPSTHTFDAIQKNFKGVNPFPDDVVVGKDGVIRYVAREYDPDAIEAEILAALAQ